MRPLLLLGTLRSAEINIRLYRFGFALVTDAHGDKWAEDLRKVLFYLSRAEYWFLSRHLIGNWWWINSGVRKQLMAMQPESFEPYSGLISIPEWEYRSLQFNIDERTALAKSCFDSIIEGLSAIGGNTMDKEAMIQHLREMRDVYAQTMANHKR